MRKLRITLAACLVFVLLLGTVSAQAVTPAKDSSGRYNVTQFGAKANDGKSDVSAIQQALDLAKNSKTTVKVYIPSGTFNLDHFLIIYSNTELIMEKGTILKGSDGIDGFIRRDQVNNTKKNYSSIQNVTISGGFFDGSAIKSNDTEFIYIDHGQNITLKDCVFQNIFGTHAIQLDGVKNVTCSNLTFKDCTRCTYANKGFTNKLRTSEALHIDHISTDGVSAAGARPCNDGLVSSNILVENCKFENCNAGVGCHWATNISRGTGFTVKNCTFTGIKYNPINVASYNGINITGNTADDAVCFIQLWECAGTVSNNTITKTHAMPNGTLGYGILAFGCKNTASNKLTVKGNTLKNCVNSAIDMAKDPDSNVLCSYINIENNTITGCKAYGILCQEGSNITISGNTVKNSDKTGISCKDITTLTVSNNTVSGCGNGLDIYCNNCTGKAEGNNAKNIGPKNDSKFIITEGSSSGGSSAKAGWQKSGSKWWYRNSDGSYPKNTWQKIGGVWYHFDKSGYVQTGWQKIGSSWYYFNSSGAMQTGWQKISNKWYYFNSSGAMQTGWMKSGRSWYYFNASGVMQTGWMKSGRSWYYFNASGAMQTGWMKSGGSWYYFKSNGVMAANETVNGYKFNASGVWVS